MACATLVRVEPDAQAAKDIHIEVVDEIGLSDKVRWGQRSYMSSWMLRSAGRFAEDAATIERDHAGDWSAPHCDVHMDLVVASVVQSVAFLEALINEVFTDVVEAQGLTEDGYLANLSEDTIRLMADWWGMRANVRDDTLSRYQQLLSFAGLPLQKAGTEPYQGAKLAVRLRNTIVHYKPETIWSDEVHAVSEQFRSTGIVSNQLQPFTGLRWPNGLLGAGCAKWCLRAVRALADDVMGSVGIVPNYRRLDINAGLPE